MPKTSAIERNKKRIKLADKFAAKNRAVVEGVAMIKKHLKKSQENPQGNIAEREGSVHISNLMLQSRYDASKRAKKTEAKKA